MTKTCECDNTHANNKTVCQYCWSRGIRYTNKAGSDICKHDLIWQGCVDCQNALKKNPLSELRLVAQDFSTLTAKATKTMSRRELVSFLKDQLAEMRREPEAKKILASVLRKEKE